MKQFAGYESIVLVLLLLMWASYRYWKSTKSGELAAEMEEDENNDDETVFSKAIVEPEPEAYLDVESTIYNEKASSSLSVSLTGISSEVSEVPAAENSDFFDFDPQKAVIWSEILKRPSC